MSYHWGCVGLILACMVGVAHADPWDDFANNLFTDLAPLLALFGERATMQFMSQALGWEDCVILAMAPLGIITILVSAIRVGGPAWLRAVVGRARENVSAAEMELMSSTSKEVCELYNGQTIVRCQGSTPVWEFIYLIPTTSQNQASKKRLDIKVVTLEEACNGDKKLLRKLEDGPSEGQVPPSQDSPASRTSKLARIIQKVFARSPSPSTRDVSIETGAESETFEKSPDEAIYVIRNMGSDAPNIILNLQSNNINRKELRAYAMIGAILQLCVLVFFGIITYHPTIKDSFQKDDQPVDDYAFPLAISGTLVLALGVFLCGTVVEMSTHETHYKKNENYDMRIVWVQQKQTVGDQVFEPFAILPDKPRDVVTMSRRRDKSKVRPLEPLTIIGICTGLAGFIIQFIGLRGMNSAATLAQLGVVGIMTAIRAWVRRRLAKPPQQEELTSGFELDTLAWALTLLNHSQIEGSGLEASPTGSDQSPDPDQNTTEGGTHQGEDQSPRDAAQPRSKGGVLSLENQDHCSWSLSTGGDVDHQPFLQIGPRSKFRAQQVFETRWKLTRLAQFKGASATEAVNLATAMEKAMNVLFPLSSKDSEKAWTWLLVVVYRDSELTESQCCVNISLTGKDGAWKVLADQLESVLSLSLFTAQREEESRSNDGQAELNLNDENDDWLRQKTMNSGLGIRLFGSIGAEKTDQLIQDLRWWEPETFEEIQEVVGLPSKDNTEMPVEVQSNQSIPSTKGGYNIETETREELDQILKPDPRWDDICVDDNRVVGYGPARPLRPQSKITRHRCFRNFSTLTDSEKKEIRRGTLAIESNDSLERLFAKDLLFSFLISAAKTLPTPLQTEVTTREAHGYSNFDEPQRALVTKEMASMAAEFGRLGYGTRQEACISVIAPLSITEKLPFPRPLFDLHMERGEEWRRNHHWLAVNETYLELWYQTRRLSLSAEKIRGWGTTFLLEYIHDLDDDMERATIEKTPDDIYQQVAMNQICESLQASKHRPDFFTYLLILYERQGRPLKLEQIRELADFTSQDSFASQDSFPDYFGITELHLKAMDPSGDGIRGCSEEAWNAINERDIFDWTPLHWAAATRNHEAIKALAERGADPNLKSLNGFTPVHYLCQYGYEDPGIGWRVNWKLDARNLDGATPMHIAASSGNLRLIEEENRQRRGLLEVEGQKSKSTSNMRDYNGRLPIHWAVIKGQKEVVRFLKNTIDEPDIYGWTSLHLATLHHTSGSGMLRAVFQLTAQREKTDEKGYTPLTLACYMRKLQAVNVLIEVGADVNSTAPDGRTALHAAARYVELETMKVLLLGGANPNIKDNQGRTPLHEAVESRTQREAASEEMVKILLEGNADPRARDSLDQTPLDIAVEGMKTGAAKYLRRALEAGEPAST